MEQEIEARTAPLWELVQSAHVAERRFTAIFATAGLTPAQYGVLASLADGDDLSQADLARSILVRPQSMARLVSSMVELGLVARSGPGGRGRRTGLVLTAKGRAAFRRARPAAYAANTAAALGLDDAEVHTLVSLLRRVRAAVERDAAADSR